MPPYTRNSRHCSSKIVSHQTPSVFIFFHNIVQCYWTSLLSKHFAGSALPDYCPKLPWESIYCTNLWSSLKVQCSVLLAREPFSATWKTLPVETSCGFNPACPRCSAAVIHHSCWLTSNRCLLLVYGFCCTTTCVWVNFFVLAASLSSQYFLFILQRNVKHLLDSCSINNNKIKALTRSATISRLLY